MKINPPLDFERSELTVFTSPSILTFESTRLTNFEISDIIKLAVSPFESSKFSYCLNPIPELFILSGLMLYIEELPD